MSGIFRIDTDIPWNESRGRKGRKKHPLLWKGVIAKRAGSLTYKEAVEVIYTDYSMDLPKVSGNQEKRRKTDIATKIRKMDEYNK